jgi:hypothetical protein
VRLSMKLFNVFPEELPITVRQDVQGLIAADPVSGPLVRHVTACTRPSLAVHRLCLLLKGHGRAAHCVTRRTPVSSTGEPLESC